MRVLNEILLLTQSFDANLTHNNDSQFHLTSSGDPQLSDITDLK